MDKNNYKELLSKLHHALDDKLGIDVLILDISELSSIGDYFIIVNGNNENHVNALASSVKEELHKNGHGLLHSEGTGESGWILLDSYGLIVHIFDKDTREFYNLEKMWNDAKRVELM